MQVIKKTQANFRFATDILKRLGEELNPNPSQGIIELVKNSYDADAKICEVELFNINREGGKIVVKDDGRGMEEKDILEGWLVLGKSKKDYSLETELGRIPVGNKGLGRLAALRLGHKTELKSVSSGKPHIENFVEIDWDKFDKSEIVEDVDLSIKTTQYDKPRKVGSSISIENLRNSITLNEVKKLARSMVLLADPFGDIAKGFKPVLKSKEFKELERIVASKYFVEAEFHLIAEVKNGLAETHVEDHLSNVLFSGEHRDIAKKGINDKYNCPDARLDLWVFILNQAIFSTRKSSISEVKEWLIHFGGVHFYHNGIRVAPYGDSGNDWLEMNLKRTRDPELRPSTYTSIGRIDVTDKNYELMQKTDRAGFIENEVFEQIKRFAIDAFDWMAKERIKERESKRIKERTEAPSASDKAKDSLKEVFSELPAQEKDKVERAFSNYDRSKEKEVNLLRKEVQLYRTLSTVGITSAVFAHESANNPIKIISQTIKTIKSRTKSFRKYKDLLQKPIERIITAIEALRVLANVTLSLVDHEKRRASKIDLHDIINEVIGLYEPFIEGRMAKVELELCDGSPYLRGSQAALESIFSNLLNNSLFFFENVKTKERRIRIKTKCYENSIEINVSDNGPGIQNIDVKDIWLPGHTTKKNGTGLGLTIVKDAVSDLGGRVSASEKGELGGAEMIITLPILGV